MREQVFGWLSIAFCLIGFSLQIHKIIFKKNIKSISIYAFAIASAGSMMWSVHSLFASAFHGGFENAIITFTSGIILFCAMRNRYTLKIRILISLSITTTATVLATILWINFIAPKTVLFVDNQVIEIATGCIAGILMSVSFLPQIIKVFITKDVNDISLYMSLFYGLAQVVLIIYWTSRSSSPLGHWLPGTIFCSCVLMCQALLFVLKIFFSSSYWSSKDKVISTITRNEL